jgi:mono/diheme cytochrome c family protein
MRLVKVLVGSVIAALLVGGITAGIFSFHDGRADANDTAQVALGKAVYVANCASCHGADLEGQPDWRVRKADGRLPAPPHDASGHTWHHPDSVLFSITKDGLAEHAPPGYKTDMPAFGDVLTDEEIWAALAYIKSRWPAETRARQEAISKRARK